MASVDTGGGEAKKGKPQKKNLRVDFTPMVDMNMLLITFFMFCTTLSKPQMMNLVMPTKDAPVDIEQRSKVDKDKTVTVLLGADDVIYYYWGEPDYEDSNTLQTTNFSPGGLRAMLTERNGKVLKQIIELRQQKAQEKIKPEDFNERSSEIKDDKDAIVVVIKPTEDSTYKNLVDVLDEMQICAIGTYAIVDLTPGDHFLLDHLNPDNATTTVVEQ